MGDRGGPKSRHRKVTNSNPQSADPQSAQSVAAGAREPRPVGAMKYNSRWPPSPNAKAGREQCPPR
eukprot:1914856-Alexandrium_andersonii.AAC.1